MITQTKNQNLIKFITTFFFLGYFPLIPGTFGSLAGLLIFIILRNNPYLFLASVLLVLTLGFLLSAKAARLFECRDPRQIVIDEVGGMLVSFLALPREVVSSSAQGRLIMLLGFIIFRILDGIKLFPANRLQHRQGSLSIMGDDLVAGIYTNLILRFLIAFLL